MIVIIDSGIANVGSVLTAFRRIGVAARTTQAAGDVDAASALVLPGVGAFRDGMNSLRAQGLVDPILAAVTRGTPMLGICLGMQLLADASEEFGEHAGLGLVPGRVVRLRPGRQEERVPNIGWCDVHFTRPCRLFEDVAERSSFYFVHSYQLQCAAPENTVASISFGGVSVTAAIERGTVFGAQFHPEKSQDVGLTLLHNYARLVREYNA
jgi:imidazole glycerol-phosphate synthase subunit HisH